MKCEKYLDVDVGKTISGVVKRLSKKEDEIMEKYNLSHFHSRYIANIYKHNSVTMSDLTEMAGVDKANTTRVVKDLLSKDIVEKNGGIRKFQLSLTEKGKEIAKLFKREIESFMKKVFANFKDSEINTLFELLEKLCLGAKSALEG